MIKVGIIGGETVAAGELIRLLVNHPDVNLRSVSSPVHTGVPLTAVHRGLEGDTDLRFSADLSADEALRNLDAVFVCGEPWQARQFVDAVDMLSAAGPGAEGGETHHQCDDGDGCLRIVDLTGAYRPGGAGMVYGLPEYNRKALVRGAVRATVPSAVAMAVEPALFPLAKSSVLQGGITITVDLPSTEQLAWNGAADEADAALSTRFDPVAPAEYRPDAEGFAQEISRLVKEVMPQFSGMVNVRMSRSHRRRGVRAVVDLATAMSMTDVCRTIDNAYDDHAFTYRVDHVPDIDEAMNTNKCLIYVGDPRVPDDLGTASSEAVAPASAGLTPLRLVSVIDNLLKGGAGNAVHCMNLLFGLSERTGLALKSSAI